MGRLVISDEIEIERLGQRWIYCVSNQVRLSVISLRGSSERIELQLQRRHDTGRESWPLCCLMGLLTSNPFNIYWSIIKQIQLGKTLSLTRV